MVGTILHGPENVSDKGGKEHPICFDRLFQTSGHSTPKDACQMKQN